MGVDGPHPPPILRAPPHPPPVQSGLSLSATPLTGGGALLLVLLACAVTASCCRRAARRLGAPVVKAAWQPELLDTAAASIGSGFSAGALWVGAGGRLVELGGCRRSNTDTQAAGVTPRSKRGERGTSPQAGAIWIGATGHHPYSCIYRHLSASLTFALGSASGAELSTVGSGADCPAALTASRKKGSLAAGLALPKTRAEWSDRLWALQRPLQVRRGPAQQWHLLLPAATARRLSASAAGP